MTLVLNMSMLATEEQCFKKMCIRFTMVNLEQKSHPLTGWLFLMLSFGTNDES